MAKKTTENQPELVEMGENLPENDTKTPESADYVAAFEARIVADATPEAYLVRLDMVSSSTGETAKPGQVVTAAGFLAHCDENGISLLLQRGAIVPYEEE